MEICDTGIDAFECGALEGPAPYYAAVINKIDNGKGYWNYLDIGIFERGQNPPDPEVDKKIGEYKRNYSALYRTFHPFKLKNKWYALYSKNYTSTRIMSLPECIDIGGEKDEAFGFCPVDYFVPGLNYLESWHGDPSCQRFGRENKVDWTNTKCTCDMAKYPFKDYSEWHFPDRIHGFVAGCVWGDDNSWKIEYLDLSHADEGIIKRDARFGYIELPPELRLNQAIELDVDDEDGSVYNIRIDVQKHFDIDGTEI